MYKVARAGGGEANPRHHREASTRGLGRGRDARGGGPPGADGGTVMPGEGAAAQKRVKRFR